MTRFLRYFIRYDGPDEWVYRYAARKFLTGTALACFGATIGLMLAYVWFGNETVCKLFITTYFALLGNLFFLFKV